MIFPEFPKIPRLSRDVVITEKIDGSNASIYIDLLAAYGIDSKCDFDAVFGPEFTIFGEYVVGIGSRTRWITPTNDNLGFAKWVQTNLEELVTKLGPGHHFGEWWGAGIQRRYGLAEKRFSLFNTSRWTSEMNSSDLLSRPDMRHRYSTQCLEIPSCHVVPVIWQGKFDTADVEDALTELSENGSWAAPTFMQPEGVVVYHIAGNQYFKETILKDEGGKGQ